MSYGFGYINDMADKLWRKRLRTVSISMLGELTPAELYAFKHIQFIQGFDRIQLLSEEAMRHRKSLQQEPIQQLLAGIVVEALVMASTFKMNIEQTIVDELHR